jgi:hypothetical protein
MAIRRYGPRTNPGHNSIIHMIESQMPYVIRKLWSRRVHEASHADFAAEHRRLPTGLDGTVPAAKRTSARWATWRVGPSGAVSLWPVSGEERAADGDFEGHGDRRRDRRRRPGAADRVEPKGSSRLRS